MESKRVRFRMCEVCERNEFLNEDKIKEALTILSDKVIKYCYIFHDKDKLNDDTLKSAHYHIIYHKQRIYAF